MNEKGEWKISPAYDITFSSGPQGYQSMLVMGEGRNPTIQHLMELGSTADLDKAWMKEVIAQTQAALSRWPEYAAKFGVGSDMIRLVKSKLSINL